MTNERDPAGWREDLVEVGGEAHETRLRRLKIRCWRRGTKEMDLILGGYLDARGAELSGEALTAFEALLREDDADLYRWITAGDDAPAGHRAAIDAIRRHHGMG